MRKHLLPSLAATALLSVPILPARAQWVVTDPANLIENIISALENTEAVLNQVTQLEHEIQSLAYQAQNLEKLPVSISDGILNQYTGQFSQLVTAMRSIDGIARDVATLTAKYDATFPNTSLAQGPLSTANVMSQLTSWLNQSRSVYQGAYKTQAQVMTNLGADSTAVQTLLRSSGSSQGALGAIQAGNQLAGQVASQLMKINQQMAATDQAQMNWIAQQTQMIDQAQKISLNAMIGYTAPNTAVVNLTYNRLH